MAALVMCSGPARSAAIRCLTAMVARGVFPAICGGSAVTVSSCTVIARIVPSAAVMAPRSAGMRMTCSL